MRRSSPRDARTARLVEQIVAAKRALAETSAEERALARRHQRALGSLTAIRYRAKAAYDAGDAKAARRAEAQARRQQASVRVVASNWERCKSRLSMRSVDFRDVSRRLVGPPEPAPRIVMRRIKAERVQAHTLLDEIEALLRTTPKLDASFSGPTSRRWDRKMNRTLLEVANLLVDAKRCLAVAIAYEEQLAKRHAKEAGEVDTWRRMAADAGMDEILAPAVSRFEKEAAAIEYCWAAQRDSVTDTKDRLEAVLALEAEARRARSLLSAGNAIAIARTAVAAARAHAQGVRANESFIAAKRCVAIVIADEKRLARLLDETRQQGAATDSIERHLVTQRQAKDDLLGALRTLAQREGPVN